MEKLSTAVLLHIPDVLKAVEMYLKLVLLVPLGEVMVTVKTVLLSPQQGGKHPLRMRMHSECSATTVTSERNGSGCV